jgi:nucleoside-diphosphate-sugar epimerase
VNILVTGGTGFIGSAIVKNLLISGHKVKVFDNNSRGAISRLDGLGNFEFIEGDIRDFELVKKACKEVDVIVHAAFINGTKRFYESPYEVIDVGINGASNVIKAIDIDSTKRIVLISSSEVYQSPLKVPTPEDISLIIPDLKNPRYSYGGSKIASELIFYYYCQYKDIDLQIIRPHNIYGPNMGDEHVVPQLNSKIFEAFQKKDHIIEIQGSGYQTRAFCYIDDFVQGLQAVMSLPIGSSQDVFNIGNDSEVSIYELAKIIGSKYGLDLKFRNIDAPFGGTNRRCPNIDKIRQIGFKPTYDLGEGIDRYVKWFQEIHKA